MQAVPHCRQLDEGAGAAAALDLSGVSAFPAKSFFGTLSTDVVSERKVSLSRFASPSLALSPACAWGRLWAES